MKNTVLFAGRNIGLKQADGFLFSHLNFELQAGMCLGLSGRSGEGKSTLLRCLAALVPITEGEIYYRGNPVSGLEKSSYRQHVLYLPQTPQLQGVTVQDALDYPFTLKAYQHRSPFDVPAEALGLPINIVKQRLQHLSGGERQRIQLWRALRLNPEILLLDEPTAALDKSTQKQVESLFQNWLSQPCHACIWISHDQAQLQRLQSQALVLKRPANSTRN